MSIVCVDTVKNPFSGQSIKIYYDTIDNNYTVRVKATDPTTWVIEDTKEEAVQRAKDELSTIALEQFRNLIAPQRI